MLAFLYGNGVPSKSAVLSAGEPASFEDFVAVARFAHAYDVPHVDAYLTAHVQAQCLSRDHCSLRALTGCSCEKLLAWALMADKYDMHELGGHCERAMMMNWSSFHGKPELVDQLSSSALQRIAKGLSNTLLAPIESIPYCDSTFPKPKSIDYSAHQVEEQIRRSRQQYPDTRDFIAWRQQQRPTGQGSGTTRPAEA